MFSLTPPARVGLHGLLAVARVRRPPPARAPPRAPPTPTPARAGRPLASLRGRSAPRGRRRRIGTRTYYPRRHPTRFEPKHVKQRIQFGWKGSKDKTEAGSVQAESMEQGL